MKSFLDRLPATLYRSAKGKFKAGTFYVKTIDTSKPLDGLGYPEAAFVKTGCEGFADGGTDRFRGATTRVDAVLNIFAASIPGITPKKDDCIAIDGVTYQINLIKSDPATAVWACGGMMIQGNSQVTIDLLNALAKLANVDLPT